MLLKEFRYQISGIFKEIIKLIFPNNHYWPPCFTKVNLQFMKSPFEISEKCASETERNSFSVLHLSVCPSVTVPSDYLSRLALRGTPTLKEATLPFNNSFCQRDTQRGRDWDLKVTSSRMAPIVTDAINRNLHSSQQDGLGTAGKRSSSWKERRFKEGRADMFVLSWKGKDFMSRSRTFKIRSHIFLSHEYPTYAAKRSLFVGAPVNFFLPCSTNSHV